MRGHAPPSSVLQQQLLQRVVDILGVALFLFVLLILADSLEVWQPDYRAFDLRVYHLAFDHIASDDLYLHGYPRLPFTYPPSALLVLPVVGLPWPAARLALYLISAACVWLTVHLTLCSAASRSAFSRPGAVGVFASLTLLSFPLWHGLSLGQAAPIVMGLTALATLGRASRFSGFWLGSATAIKLTPAVFAFYWWINGRRRDARIASGTFAMWTLAGALVMPESSRWYFLKGGAMQADVPYANLSNQSLKGIVLRAGFDSFASWLVVVSLSLALLAWALDVSRRLTERGWIAAAVPLVGVWAGVASPIAWVHAFGWWVPLAAAVGVLGRTIPDVVAAVALIVTPYAILTIATGSQQPDSVVAHLVAAEYTILAIFVTAWLGWRIGRPSPAPEDLAAVPPTPDRAWGQ